MQVTRYEWGPLVQQEANRCWAYSILASILLSLIQLLATIFPTRTEASGDEKAVQQDVQYASVRKPGGNSTLDTCLQLTIDLCDILIPAAALSWLNIEQRTVGIAGSMSTIIAARQIWIEVQSKT